MSTYLHIARPRDEGLRLLASAASAVGALEDPLRGEINSHAARIADCLIEVAGGVTVQGAQELYAVASAAAGRCVAKLEAAAAVPGACRVFQSLEALLRERLEAARQHGRRADLGVFGVRALARRIVH